MTFARATDAILAAVAAQRALNTYPWPEGLVVRVRMGLHTGEPSLVSEGYVGLDVHYIARLMRAAHGGQVLLSQTTRDLVAHDLPDGVSLRDLGEHRLKDLQRSNHLYQLVIADLPADFPPLKTLDSRPNNLPVQPTTLIGREKEVTALLNLLQREEVHLVTLTGPGGMGKTRLGLQVAAELIDLFPDGVYFVNLAPISDPELVVPTLAQTLDVKEIAEQPLLDLLKASLRWKHLLLLLDNFEQVIGKAVFVADLLATCSLLKVIVTSRAALHVRVEQEFAVPPLAVPDPKRLPDLMALSQCEAVALFIQRAQAVKPEFQVTNANAPAVAEICVRLDGLPLAIELAAARVKLFPPQALLARLGQRLAVLTGGAKDVPARQQTLRNTIEWSYHLLDVQEQQLFRRLSAFVGGCTLEAIEAVCNALDNNNGAVSVLDGVASLIDKSLLQQTEREGEEPRLAMLETIREYGLEALETCGDMEITRQAHAMYYLAMAEKAEPKLEGPQQAVWLDRLEREYDNLRSALRWFLERGEMGHSIELALRQAGALRRFWEVRGHWSEGWNFLERALAGSKGVAVPVQLKALKAAAHLAYVRSDTDRAEVLSEECLARCRVLGDKAGMALSLRLLGSIALSRCNFVVACSQTEEGLALCREVGHKDGIVQILRLLGEVFLQQGDTVKAHTLLEESVALSREIGYRHGIAESLFVLGRVAAYQSDYAAARAFYEESLYIGREVGDNLSIGFYLEGLADVVAMQGDPAQAARLWGVAEALRDANSIPIVPIYRAEYERSVAATRAQLGEQAFAAVWAEGRMMTPEQALAAQGKAMIPTRPTSATPKKSPTTSPGGLSVRELEVLRLLALGLTDAQIAEQLVLSLHTIHAHLRTIYSKLGVTSRSAATRYAFEHQLV